MKHVFYIPYAYCPLIYALISGSGLLFALFVGLVQHPKELLITGCGEDHWEFWPSISTTIGDMQPERQIWRVAFVLCAAFRIGSTVTIFNTFWQKGCGGMSDLKQLMNQPRQLLSSSAFLTVMLLWVDAWRLVAAIVWTMVNSNESLAYHNVGFCPYVFLCFVMQVLITTLVSRNSYNFNIYASRRDAQVSHKFKKVCMIGEAVASACVVVFFLRHFATCADGSFSLANMWEWVFATCNIAYDGSCWFEMKLDGWWMSVSPEYLTNLLKTPSVATPAGAAALEPQPPTVTSGSAEGAAAAAAAAEGEEGVVPSSSSAVRIGNAASVDDPMEPTSGEPFLAPDMVLHRFRFCCAPSQLTMWLCDIYWGHLFFECIIHLISHMYYLPLVAMSISWELSSVIFFTSPILLRVAKLRRRFTGPSVFAKTWFKPAHNPIGTSHRVVPMYVFLYLCAALSHMHMLVTTTARGKLLAVSIGGFFIPLATFARYLYPSPASSTVENGEDRTEDFRRMIYSLPMGMILAMLLRMLYIGLSPVYTEPLYAAVVGIILGLIFTFVIYRHAMFGNVHIEARASSTRPHQQPSWPEEGNSKGEDGEESASTVSNTRQVRFADLQARKNDPNTMWQFALSYPPVSHALLGLLFGLTCALVVNFFLSANMIPRFLAMDPFPSSILVVIVLFLGIYYSSDVVPVFPQLAGTRNDRRRSIVQRMLHLVLRGSWLRVGVLQLLGALLLLYGTSQTNHSYEVAHDKYPVTVNTKLEDLSLEHWRTTEFYGSKNVAFGGGLIVTFIFGALMPAVMEMTFVHIAAQRFHHMFTLQKSVAVEKNMNLLSSTADLTDAQLYKKEGGLLRSFEFCLYSSALCYSFLYVLTSTYPFIPLGWIFREKKRGTFLVHLMLVYLLAFYVSHRMVRGARKEMAEKNNTGSATTTTTSNTTTTTTSTSSNSGGMGPLNAEMVTVARQQRSLHLFIVILFPLVLLAVLIGRTSMGYYGVVFPAGKDTAAKYTKEVLHLHQMMLELRTTRNGMTDPDIKKAAKSFLEAQHDESFDEMRKNVTETKESKFVHSKYEVGHLTKNERKDVFRAAEALTQFSGFIWTVHFALDNFNVDSSHRIVEMVRRYNPGVVGLLESDTMHIVNNQKDLVEYVAYYTGYAYTDYGPTALDDTYGCALLSKYPIRSVKRYIMPSPIGELACLIHAELDVFGIIVHTYVGHFGNTEHAADGILQSQFLAKMARENAGPSMFLGYLVTHPGESRHYGLYSDPKAPGKFRDTALDLYVRRPWVRLQERGGLEKDKIEPYKEGQDKDFNVEYKLLHVPEIQKLESELEKPIDVNFRRTPTKEKPRVFYFNQTNRYTVDHPRFEFIDRYCQYTLYKTGAESGEDEKHKALVKNMPLEMNLYDWQRFVSDKGVADLSDTEIQRSQFVFSYRKKDS